LTTDFQTLLVPVAAGELIDKITILRLKAAHLTRPEALRNVQRELRALEAVQMQALDDPKSNEVDRLTKELEQINTQLWDIEDNLRQLEAEQRFDVEFIDLARSVYQLNDQRSELKRQINLYYRSTLMEEKSYGEHS